MAKPQHFGDAFGDVGIVQGAGKPRRTGTEGVNRHIDGGMTFGGPFVGDMIVFFTLEDQASGFVIGGNHHQCIFVATGKVDRLFDRQIEQQCLTDDIIGIVAVGGPVNLAAFHDHKETVFML